MYLVSQGGPLDLMLDGKEMPIRPPVTGARSRMTQQNFLADPNTPVTVTAPQKVGSPNISDLITHIAKSDNHLWQALTSLQAQTNQLAGSQTVWAAWNPQISDQSGNILAAPDLAAYYMIMNNTLFVQLNVQNLTFTQVSTTALQIILPINIGRIVIQTCAAYLIGTQVVNDVMALEAYDNIIDAYLRTVPSGQYPFMLGGSFLIFG